MLKFKISCYLLILFFLLLFSADYTLAAELRISPERDQILPREQITINIEYEPLEESEGEVMLNVSRGIIMGNEVQNNILKLKNGEGNFIYQAPDKTGKFDILAISLDTNLSARTSLEVIDEYDEANWEEQYAVITEVIGNAAYQRSGETGWNTAIDDDELYQGDSLRTWANSWAYIRLFDDSELILEPHTSIRVQNLKSLEDDDEIKRSQFKIFSGNILSEVSGYLARGARFEIESESTAAGVRGTFFEYITSSGADSEIIVYEGAVDFYHPETGIIFNVGTGQKVVMKEDYVEPDVIEHDISKEERLQEIEQKQAEIKEQIEETDEIDDKEVDDIDHTVIEETEEPESIMARYFEDTSTNLILGSEVIDEEYYLNFSIQPELNRILGTGVSLGFNMDFYQDSEGDIYFGSLDEEVKVHNLINWIEYDGKHLYLNYGFMQNIDYGYGLLMGNYSKPDSRGIQLGLDSLTDFNLGGRVLLPFDVVSLYPWKIESTSSLYALRFTKRFSNLIPFTTGVNYIVETNTELEKLDYSVPLSGLSFDLGIQRYRSIEPYLEAAVLNKFGAGGEIGVRGNPLSGLYYQLGFQVIGEEFTPNYFGGNYEFHKNNSLANKPSGKLPELTADNYPFNQGIYVELGINILGRAFLTAGYEHYKLSSDYSPILTANLDASLPFVNAEGGFNYRQSQFNIIEEETNLFFNENTEFMWYVNYQLESGLEVMMENTFIPSDQEIDFKKSIGFSISY